MKINATLAVMVSVACFFSGKVRSEEAPEVINVWPGAVPNESAITGPETDTPAVNGMLLPKQSFNVSHATLTVFRPEGKNSQVAVVVCPGGGFRDLEMEKEGEAAARWLNTLGVTAVVLKYRVHNPPLTDPPANMLALQDAQRALRIVRSKADDWGIKTDKVGIMGFSAGAALSALAGTHGAENSYPAVDSLDSKNCRPDFAVVVYPGGIINEAKDGLAPAVTVSKASCQMFIVQAETDRVNSENSVFLFLALKRAGVSAEMHLYAVGAHGFGLQPSKDPHGSWPQRCAEWLVDQKILEN